MLLDTNLVSVWIGGRDARRYPATFREIDALLARSPLSISMVTLYELRRGVEALLEKDQGRSKRVAIEKFLDRVELLGLDGPDGGGWNVAARFWARARSKGITFTDGDLLITATASFHKRELITSDRRLVDNLLTIGAEVGIRHIERG